MTILIIYSDIGKGIKTIEGHLRSFKRYGKGHQVFYLELSRADNLSEELIKIPFDLVVFHYTFLAQRFAPDNFNQLYRALRPKLIALQGVKVLLPQDEYIYTQALWRIINDCNIKRIYTCMKESDYPVLYPEEKIGKREDLFRRVFTGYVDEKLLRWIQRRQIPHERRPKDVVFRSTRSTYAFGMMGQQKTKIAESFMEAVKTQPAIQADICLTLPNSYANTITGNAWIKFLLSSRTALGTLSGSSLFDPEGSIKEEVRRYLGKKPNATDEDIERECYRGRDGTITSYVLGPRHFECAMTKTCQILLEGIYDNMTPGVDYIEVKSDFSNIDEVLEQIKDREYCEQIAEHCYKTFVESGNMRYSDFVVFVLGDASTLLPSVELGMQGSLLKLDSQDKVDNAIRKQKKAIRLAARGNKTKIVRQKTSVMAGGLKNQILILAQKSKMRKEKQKTRLLMMRQRCAMWLAGRQMHAVLFKQRLTMLWIIIKHHITIFKQRAVMFKYMVIDRYYVAGRWILNKLKPTHPRLYSVLYKVRCLLKKRKGLPDSDFEEKG